MVVVATSTLISPAIGAMVVVGGAGGAGGAGKQIVFCTTTTVSGFVGSVSLKLHGIQIMPLVGGVSGGGAVAVGSSNVVLPAVVSV